jgi:hypothetical protein
MIMMHDPIEYPSIDTGLRLRCGAEHDRAWELEQTGQHVRDVSKPEIVPVSDDAYKTECAVLPKNALDTPDLALTQEDLPQVLEDSYPAGYVFCMAALPFTGDCFGQEHLHPRLWQEFIATRSYMKYLLVDPSDNLTFGFGDIEGYFFDALPESIRKDVSEGGCSFKLHYPAFPGSLDNKIWFVRQFNKALDNLKKLLSERTEVEKKRKRN